MSAMMDVGSLAGSEIPESPEGPEGPESPGVTVVSA